LPGTVIIAAVAGGLPFMAACKPSEPCWGLSAGGDTWAATVEPIKNVYVKQINKAATRQEKDIP
jgi:hypothetical protein